MLKKLGIRFIGASIFSISVITGFTGLAIAQHSPTHPIDKPGGKDVIKDEELDKKREAEKEESVEKYRREGGKGVHKHNEEGEMKGKQEHGISGRGESEGGAGIAGGGIVGGKETEGERRIEEAQKERAKKEEGK
jgi:hypothetical protein